MDTHSYRDVFRYFQNMRGQNTAQAGDHDLLNEFASHRDEQAFSLLMQRHGPMVLSVCRRVLHNEADAEDAFQATFIVLSKKAGSIRQGESLHSWLYKVAFRLAQRLRWQIARRHSAEVPPETPNPRVEPDALSWNEVRSALDEELQHLPEKYRAPLVLCCLSGKTRDEAAAELGWTVNVLKGRLERGRKLLRDRLLRRGVELSAALLALTLMQNKSAASTRSALMATTVKAAVASTTGPLTGIVPVHIVELVEFGLQGLNGGSLKFAALVVLVATVFVGSAMALWTTTTEAPVAPSRPIDFGVREDQPFRDVTVESGMATILDEKYAAKPKWWLSGMHLVDLDGDGKLDLFLSAPGSAGSIAALNDGKGHFKPAPGTFPPTELRLAHDLNEDGKIDLTFTFQDGGGQWWLNKSRPGTLQFEPTTIERTANTARRQAMIDIDRDGRADWIRGVPDVLAFDLADGKGGFSADAGQLPLGDTRGAETLSLPVDFDADGDIDFVVEWGHFGNNKGSSRLYRNDGRMNFTDVTQECGLRETDLAIKGVGDVNQDGYPDLIVLEDLRPEIYLNDGKGKFTRKPNAITGMEWATPPSMASWGVAVMTDFDNDGVPDLLWNGKHFLWVLRGTGDGHFCYRNKEWGIKDLSTASVDDGHCFGDINGDGLLDMVGYTTNDTQRRFAIYQSTLSPLNAWVRVRPLGQAGNRGATGAKVRLFEPQSRKLLWYEQIAIYNSQSAQSYYSYGTTERHYGLGRLTTVDVEIEFYPSGKKVVKQGVAANGVVTIREE